MNLKTKYLGLELRTPLVASASPISAEIANIKKLEDSGASAIVLYSLFEEQLRLEQRELHYHTTYGTESFAEATSYFPSPEEFRLGPEEYLNHISKAKDAVKIPIIASLNGTTVGGWTDFARQMQAAGADAIELNIYNIPTDIDLPGSQVEENDINVLKAVKSAVSIPVSIKVSPFFSNMANMAKKLDDAGADAIVLFNRFYQPDINLEELEVIPQVALSHSGSNRISMRWIAILKDKIKADLAATSGLHNGHDVIKMMMVGASVGMLCSALLKHGIDYIKVIEKEMIDWMERNEYDSIQQMQGSMSQAKVNNPDQFERAQYMKALTYYQF